MDKKRSFLCYFKLPSIVAINILRFIYETDKLSEPGSCLVGYFWAQLNMENAFRPYESCNSLPGIHAYTIPRSCSTAVI